MRRIIINADDFGLSNGVNKGIAKLVKKGVVTSISFMVNLPGFEDGVNIAKSFPDLSVGIHLNLTYGYPLLPPDDIKTLVNNENSFKSDVKWLRLNADSLELEKEFRAQIERFLATGIPLTHLDTHHNLQDNERVLEILIALAKEYHISTFRRLKSKILSRSGILTTDTCTQWGFWDDDAPEIFRKLLTNLGPGVTEITCHPGYVDQDLTEISPWTLQREKELKFFSKKETRDMIKESDAELISFHQFNNGI